MRISEYKCRVCHQHFEVQAAENDPAREITCPKCRSTEVRKAESASGIPAALFPTLGGRFT
ncbi:FmdB family zinc ribbon protein [Desulfococcus sp.]|uniref:FmdB family zinc ribbon protein n=1 Tax=Desulfococcus sp. TaxID=2025834 RepID=UPI0035931F99